MSRDVGKLFQSAKEQGLLSTASSRILMVEDIGAEIEAALGVNIDEVTASEVILVTIMPDDSGSIQAAGNEQLVREGHNLVLSSLQATKQVESILAHTRYLNGRILFPYRPIDKVEKMTARNYAGTGGTPLYDQSIVLLGTVLAKAQEFAEAGIHTRTVTLILSDGEDLHSRRQPKDCAEIVRDMLKSENHIIAAMGISDGHTDFQEVFKEMGIPERWILIPQNTAHDIRQAFQMFSRSAVRASQSGQNFSQTSLGGFSS